MQLVEVCSLIPTTAGEIGNAAIVIRGVSRFCPPSLASFMTDQAVTNIRMTSRFQVFIKALRLLYCQCQHVIIGMLHEISPCLSARGDLNRQLIVFEQSPVAQRITQRQQPLLRYSQG